MNSGILRAVAMLGTLTLLLICGRVALAQTDKPASPAAIIALPATGTTNAAITAWTITQTGTGRAGYFAVSNSGSVTAALEARNYSSAANASAITAVIPSPRAATNSAALAAINYGAGNAVLARVTGSGSGVFATANGGGGKGVYGASKSPAGSGAGIYGEGYSPNGYGVYGINYATSSNAYGVYGETRSNTGYGVYGKGQYGLYGVGTNYGAYGKSGFYGVYGDGASTGVYGTGTYYGLQGYGDTGVYAEGRVAIQSDGRSYGLYAAADSIGVYGTGPTGVNGNGSTYGVYGSSGNIGVYGNGSSRGVQGNGSNIGVRGESANIGVWGQSTGTAAGTYGGVFSRNIYVYGRLYTDGTTVGIRDPQDSSKLIQQAGVISPDQLGMVNGNVTLDNSGRATVALPDWFGGIYGDYRYVLTPIGDSADLFIASKVANGRFVIAGGKPGLEVSWQISGTRQDAVSKSDPLKTVVNRTDVEPNAGPDVTTTAPTAPVPATPAPGPRGSK